VFGAGAWGSLPVDGEAALTIPNYADGAVFDAAAPADSSLARVHYIRKAFADVGVVIGGASDDPAKLTPVFSGGEWVQGCPEYNLFASYLYDTHKAANKFTDAGVEIMSGIRVARDGSDGKYKIVYGRNIKVGELTYNNNASSQWLAIGIGLAKEGTGTIIPDADIKIHEGGRDGVYAGVKISNFATYIALLDSINANLIKTGVRSDNSSVQITSVGSNFNVISNGIYDFVLACYNPAADASYEGDRARLPQ
jgi:hypothetical protein